MVGHKMASIVLILLVTLPLMSAFILLSAQASSPTTQLEVTTNKECYDRGDVVILSVTGSGVIAIEVYGPNSTLIWVDQLNVSGTVTEEFRIPSNAPEGTYYVYAAASGQVPEIATKFLVKRPYFSIVNYPKNVTGTSGSLVPVNITVANEGSDGYALVEITNSEGRVIANSTAVLIPYNESRSVELLVSLPKVLSKTTFTWLLRVINLKYGTIDSSANLTVTVMPLPTTTTTTRTVKTTVSPVPPPPPPPMTTTTLPSTTTMTSLTTTTTVVIPPTTSPRTTTTTPVMIKVNLKKFMASNGTIVKKVKVRLPSGGSLIIEPGTMIKFNGTPVTQLTVTQVSSPPPTPETQVIVGPIYDVEPSGAVLSKPIIIVLPFNPAAVPAMHKPLPAYYDEVKHVWVPIEVVSINYENGTITAKVRHLSLYSVVAFRVFTVVTLQTTTTTTRSTITKTIVESTITTETLTSKTTTLIKLTRTVTSSLSPLIGVLITTAPTHTVVKHFTLTLIKFNYLTSTSTVTRVMWIPQESYVYAAFAVLIISLIVLIVASIRGGVRE